MKVSGQIIGQKEDLQYAQETVALFRLLDTLNSQLSGLITISIGGSISGKNDWHRIPRKKKIRPAPHKDSRTSGPQGFLWKPTSESDGNLVVLLPAQLTRMVSSVKIIAPDRSTILASGKNSGTGNGGREHYRFPNPGGDYPPGSYVEIVSHTGFRSRILILNPNRRIDGGKSR